MNTSHHTLYRSRHGKIFGVFQGIGDATGLSVFWMRVFAIVLVVFTGIFPVILIYIIAALFMKIEPIEPLDEDGEEFYNSVTSNRKLAMMRLSSKLAALDRRAQRIETVVTSRGSDWDKRMNDGA
jgi:phage shock protein C